MKKSIITVLLIFLTGLLSGCHKSEMAIVGMSSKCSVEYIDNDEDGNVDSAIVTMYLTLDHDSTTGYKNISVLWDGFEVVSGNSLPINDRQIIDLVPDRKHIYLIEGIWEQGSLSGRNLGSIRVEVKNGRIEPIEDIHIRSSLELSY